MASAGIRGKKRKNLTANVYANVDNSPLQSAAPIKTNNTVDKVLQTHNNNNNNNKHSTRPHDVEGFLFFE